MDEIWHIERFTGQDEGAASESFAVLCQRLRPFLNRHLLRLIPREADREDLIQAVLTKIWSKRDQFRPATVGAWYQFAATAAWRAGIDFQRSEAKVSQVEEVEDFGSVEPIVETFSTLASSARKLYEVADITWLKADPNIPLQERDRRILAAQLFYTDEASVEEILALLGTHRPVTRRDLDEWFTDPAVLLGLCFRHLYRPNEPLACQIFGVPPSQLDAFSDHGHLEGWSPIELKIGVLRTRNGLKSEKLGRVVAGATPELIESAARKCRDLFPFAELARDIKWSLRHSPKVASELNLWKRLVFQYHVADELPQKQILERIAPAAEVFGVSITANVLNAWLSIGRLFGQLERQARRLPSL